MKTKTLSKGIAALAALAFATTAANAVSQIPTTLTVSDGFITVGEGFNVTVSIDGSGLGLPEGTEISSFAFDVNHATPLNHLSYNGATVDSMFDDVSLGAINVGGLSKFPAPFPDVTQGSINLAVLNFKALSEGTDTITVFGTPEAFGQGALLVGPFVGPFPPQVGGGAQTDALDPVDVPTGDYEIAQQIRVTVNARPQGVPDSGSTVLLLGLALIGFAAASRRLGKA
jgi:hypothetical protein